MILFKFGEATVSKQSHTLVVTMSTAIISPERI